jgi:hypothetical protein
MEKLKMTQIMMATVLSHECLSGMYEISGRLIFVEQSVHVLKLAILLGGHDKIHMVCSSPTIVVQV